MLHHTLERIKPKLEQQPKLHSFGKNDLMKSVLDFSIADGITGIEAVDIDQDENFLQEDEPQKF